MKMIKEDYKDMKIIKRILKEYFICTKLLEKTAKQIANKYFYTVNFKKNIL